MPKPKKVKQEKVKIKQEAEEAIAEVGVEIPKVDQDKKELEDLYELMKKLGINSIGDVEVRLSRY